jgi:hypothetical protein
MVVMILLINTPWKKMERMVCQRSKRLKGHHLNQSVVVDLLEEKLIRLRKRLRNLPSLLKQLHGEAGRKGLTLLRSLQRKPQLRPQQMPRPGPQEISRLILHMKHLLNN